MSSQLFRSIASSRAPSVSSSSLPSFSDHFSRRHVPKYIFSFLFLITRFGLLLSMRPAFNN